MGLRNLREVGPQLQTAHNTCLHGRKCSPKLQLICNQGDGYSAPLGQVVTWTQNALYPCVVQVRLTAERHSIPEVYNPNSFFRESLKPLYSMWVGGGVQEMGNGMLGGRGKCDCLENGNPRRRLEGRRLAHFVAMHEERKGRCRSQGQRSGVRLTLQQDVVMVVIELNYGFHLRRRQVLLLLAR
jgi:hypothetical protein